MQVEVVSDFVCPWCFVGLRRLEAACRMAREAGQAVRIAWHPFLLNPDTPREGEPYREFMVRKFGSQGAVDALHRRVADAGETAGIRFRFDEMAVRPSTRLAHGVVSALQAAGHSVDGLVASVFAAHFLELRNIGDVETLTGLVRLAGLPEQVVGQVSGALPAPDDLLPVARTLQLDGVPAFLFDRRQLMQGAQPASALLAAMGLPAQQGGAVQA